MGTDALRGSGVTAKFLYLIQDNSLVPLHEPLRKVRPSMVWLFLAIELVGFGATMAITQTIGKYMQCLYSTSMTESRLANLLEQYLLFNSRYRVPYSHFSTNTNPNPCDPAPAVYTGGAGHLGRTYGIAICM